MPEEEVICLGIVDLMPRALCSGVDASKGNASTELAVHVSAVLLDVRARLRSDDVAGILTITLHDESVLELLRIGWDGVAAR